tara:strand:- start:311 stop:547 length:237 start_codon:yes stop_codon:yes gene_type:complete
MNAITNTIIKINIDKELLFDDLQGGNRDDIDTIVQKKVLGNNYSNRYITWDPVSEYTLEEIDDEQYLVFEIRYEQEDF